MDKTVLLESKIESLQIVEKIIDEILEIYTGNNGLYGNILIATLEGIQNAIIHGNKYDPCKRVNLKLEINNDKLTVITKDQGDGFDFENVPDPTSPENLELITGRGIFLMKNLSDQLNFYDDGRVSELVFNLTGGIKNR